MYPENRDTILARISDLRFARSERLVFDIRALLIPQHFTVEICLQVRLMWR